MDLILFASCGPQLFFAPPLPRVCGKRLLLTRARWPQKQCCALPLKHTPRAACKKQVSGIPAAYCQRPMLTLVIAEAQYKTILRDGPNDRAAASSLLGILYCQTQRPDEAAPLLEGAPASDWVAHEYMG